MERYSTSLEGHTGLVYLVVVTLDGGRVISASWDKTLKVWDVKNGELLHTLEGHTESILGVAVMPDGKQAISASEDKTLRIWNLENGKIQHLIEDHTDFVNDVVVTQDGERAISASNDKTLKVWNMETCELIVSFIGEGEFHTCAVSPDKRTIVCPGGRSGVVHILRLEGIE